VSLENTHRQPAEDTLSRFGVSIPARLLDSFDRLIGQKGYTNRSEAIRDLIRDRLVDSQAESQSGHVVGALVLVYDHHTRELGERLTDIQHDVGSTVISTLHVHLTHHDCLEVLALNGTAERIRGLSDRILSLKGVKHGKLVITGSGEHTR
jgi:CopG family transcriptional regulator, nickel-responsive regulator